MKLNCTGLGRAEMLVQESGLPALACGLWLGLRLYGRLDEQAFRKLILILLLVSGASLFI